MKTTFSIRLIASDHLFYDGPCTGVIIPALDGQREVLAHHESVIMAIDCGELRLSEAGSHEYLTDEFMCL